MKNTKKITLATVKSFIKKNSANLQIMCESSFNGMTDGVDYIPGANFKPVELGNGNFNNTFGIHGAWFVGQSRDYFTNFNENGFTGIHVYNCCGSFTLAIQTEEVKASAAPKADALVGDAIMWIAA